MRRWEDMMKTAIVSALAIVAFACLTGSATIINVPDDYETIQEGIDASVDGDTVRVAPGTYVENIEISQKNIVVGSWFLDDSDPSYIPTTIIDGGHAGSVVIVANGIDDAVITGFTIQNGFAEAGGGILCFDASPTISNNIIRGNSVVYPAGWGGGICCAESTPIISDNTITGNSAEFAGGGIYCESYGIIRNNTISGNSSEEYGGGIYCYYSSPAITNTILWGDSAPNDPEICLYNSSPVITYCDVEGGWAGGGNIDCDPMFCDPENGNYFLDAASCCVGAGQGGVDIGAFGVGCGEAIPTLSEWGMLIMGLLILSTGTVAVVRKRREAWNQGS
jgi:predicted outer membrane repeat protein